ncbi:CRE-STR-205 protein [Caenorhabditis remanei]|uniref:Serpentine receptor class r-10 n=1 Tax=Caenorhabditis remanei TaxID=31234 RepID=E3LK73_CAERE|nr:CRE-STR-205 protein [Caenorhabditis remanei]
MLSVSETIQTEVQKACTSIALFLNLLLIYLIINKSPKELGAYKYLMIFISVLEVVYAIVDVLVCPIIHHSEFTFLLITRLESAWFGPSIQLALSGIYCGLYGSCMAMFGIHFIYRYLVIKGNKMLKTFRSWRIFLWFSIPVIYGVVWGSIAVLFCGPRGITNRLVELDILENLDLRIQDIVYIAPYLFDDDHEIYWPTVIGLLVDCMIINSSFVTVLYFGVKLFNELRVYTEKNNNLSDRNKTLQTQLYYSLVTQTLIPIILLQVPVTILFITVFFSANFGEFTSLVSMTIAVYPAIDPLPTMFIVTSYRNAIVGKN